jgi:hypothetical protein
VLLGKATTGLVPNTVDTLDPIPLTQIRFPLGPTTVYAHKQVTALDAQSNHVWQDAPAPPTPDTSNFCTAPGTLCQLYGITVHQAGYAGYAWQGQDSRGDTRLLDRMANLTVPPGDAQQSYVLAPFGLPQSKSGARLAHSLLGQETANFYLDTTAGLIRRVTLGPKPAFDPPTSQLAWGSSISPPIGCCCIRPASSSA